MKKVISILLICVIIACCIGVVACNNSTIDKTAYYDTITKKLKLTKDYEGKNFLADGIGLATVDAYTDGDTTRFKTGGDTVVIRYYCIDTPESTGDVEKWGKAASVFVKGRLSEAVEIVLESSTGEKPVKDSYGTRYLGYVWYRTADSTEFKNLNLEVVENGFSENKAIDTSAYAYYDYFKQANEFARKNKLRLFGDDDDPLYSTEPIEMTIKDFWNNKEAYYNEELEAGSKVKFTAYIQSLRVSSGASPTYTFTAATYDVETGEKYEIDIYAGYTSFSATNLKIGNLYSIIGNVQKHYGSFQISGVSYNSVLETEMRDGTITVQRDYYMTFDSSMTWTKQHSRSLFGDVTVSSSSVEDGVLTIVGVAHKKLDLEGNYDETAKEFTFKVKVPEQFNNVYTAGKKFSVCGYQLVYNSCEILIPSLSAIKSK